MLIKENKLSVVHDFPHCLFVLVSYVHVKCVLASLVISRTLKSQKFGVNFRISLFFLLLELRA